MRNLQTLAEGNVIAISTPKASKEPDSIICFSHLRWNFVFQRPQHLMTRFSRSLRVFVFEEPVFCDGLITPGLRLERCPDFDVTIVTPEMPSDLTPNKRMQLLKNLLNELVADQSIFNPIKWYYTPEMYPFSRRLPSALVVYDCMDELANFRFASLRLPALERRLMRDADVVFTGGYSLYEVKRATHGNIHPFPSSVDRAHFGAARTPDLADPEDQAHLPAPRLGFFGVVDERMDLGLLAALADAHPDWSIVIVGPVVKISRDELPRRPNIHYLGPKAYAELPLYLAGWQVALMPFAINDATRFISPTKTPEYLAGGRPVVSTAITDVERQYGGAKCVRIAKSAAGFIAACEAVLAMVAAGDDWLQEADDILADLSWDRTHAQMAGFIERALASRGKLSPRAPGCSASVAEPRARLPAPAVRSANRRKPYDDLIVGAGFAGAVMAERLAAGAGRRVLLIDRRPHVAGNAYDHLNPDGILIHKYGPHIFHTNSEEVFRYLSRFTRWRPYEHRVLASIDGKLVPIPINRTTLNAIYGLQLKTESDAEAFLEARAEPRSPIITSEDVVISAVGRDLYERFFRSYTRKQWGMDPSELDKSVTARVPTRINDDDRYFTDRFQAMPSAGYTRMFETMLDHPNISIELGIDFAEIRRDVMYERLIYTGAIDEYYDYRYGRLPYRCLSFKHETLTRAEFQPVGVVNYPSAEVPYTRITEYKHLTGQSHPRTAITFEYPSDEGDPYYPVPRAENHALYKRYEALAASDRQVAFVGRLATYRYYNMDQVVGQALATYRRLEKATEMAPATAEPKAGEAVERELAT